MPQRYRKPSTFLDYMCEYLSRQKNYLFAKSVCRAKNSISKIEGLAEQAPCMSKAPLDRADLLLEIGIPGFPPHNNISNKAYAFSDALFDKPEDDRGSMRGSVRHVLWQAEITGRYGKDAAMQIGNCHERQKPFYPNEKLYASFDDADRAVDQLNNEIGRRLGNRFRNLSTKELALEIMNAGLAEGFYRVKKRDDGYFDVVKEPMSKDEYERVYQQLLRLNDNGKIKE